jgi:DNA-binding IclR family transcriptional regulator
MHEPSGNDIVVDGNFVNVATPSEPKHRVAAVENAVSLLNAFSAKEPRLTLTQLAKRTGFSKSTAYRMTGSLLHLGLLVRGTDGVYRLGPALLRLGKIYELSFNLAEIVRPKLAQLVAETGQTAIFYIRENDKRVCLFRHNAPDAFVLNVHEGAHLPLERGSPGRVLLAFSGEPGEIYDEIRRIGYFVSIGDREAAGAGVAAPVFGQGRHLVGALGLYGLRTQVEGFVYTKLKDITVAAAQDLTRELDR